jgi:hypothetical protein
MAAATRSRSSTRTNWLLAVGAFADSQSSTRREESWMDASMERSRR